MERNMNKLSIKILLLTLTMLSIAIMISMNVFAGTATYKVTCYMAYGFNESNAIPITTNSIIDGLAYMYEVYNYDGETDFQLPEPNVSFEDLEFAGWSINGSSEYKRNVTIPKGSKGNKIYIARWVGKEVAVNFDSQGGDAVDAIVVRYKEKLGTLPKPTRNGFGYDFDGWYTEPNGGTRVTSTTTAPNTNVTYYAHWTPIEYDIVLKEYDEYGSNKYINYTIETEDFVVGVPTDYSDSDETPHFIFIGWISDGIDTPQRKIVIPKGSFGNKYFTGVWEENPCYYMHNYKNVITPATMKTSGNIVPTCVKCGETEDKETISKIKSVSLSTTTYTYNGESKTPTVTIKDTKGTKLRKNTDYTIAYKNNKYIGTATAIITFKGKYSGTVEKTFKITPKGTTIKTLYPESKKITVKWNKQSTQVSGYQIEYTWPAKVATSKIVTVKGSSVTSKVLTGLTNDRDYYVRIRTYKTVNGTKCYSEWSELKKIHIDKTQLSNKSVSLYRGQTKKLTLKYIPAGAKPTWKSSNKKVATISSSGKITAKGLGKTTITAKYKGKTYKATINVTYMKPDMAALIYDYNTHDNYFVVKFKNNSSKAMTVLSGTTKVVDFDYKSFDRKVKLSKSYTIQPGKSRTIKFKVQGSTTWPDHDDFTLYYYFKLDGKKYYAKADSFTVTKYKSTSKWVNTYRDKYWFQDWRFDVIPCE